jgi:hypothetical protein
MLYSPEHIGFMQKQFAHIQNHGHSNALDMMLDIVKPETELENFIIQQEDWQIGAFWGEPRPGHPEGKVIFHVREVLDNVDKITQDPHLRKELRLISIIHDNFKHLEETVRPRTDWTRHHAVYAMKFASNLIDKQHVLNVIELHDEAYYAWHLNRKHPQSDRSLHRLNGLFERLGEEFKQLYYLFFKCDTLTGDKTPLPVQWFEETVSCIEIAQIEK